MTSLQWRVVGEAETLKSRRCRRLFSESGKPHDLVLVYFNDQFHAMEAWCSHMGGPLYDGDIEDFKGRPHILCPWHGYQFELESGKSEIGIMQEKFQTKVEDDKVFVFYKCNLSTEPFKK